MKKRRPDIIAILIILLGIGIVLTEISYANLFPKTQGGSTTSLSQK